MKKEGRVNLKIIILILILICVFLGISYAAVTVNTPVILGNKTSPTWGYNTIYQGAVINFTLTAGSGTQDNVTNVTIKLNATYFIFDDGTNNTNVTVTNFTNITSGGYIELTWNVTTPFESGSSQYFSFNVSLQSNVETLNTPIEVEVANVSGKYELTLSGQSYNVNVDNKAPVVSFMTVNNTNTTNVTSFLFSFNVTDINNDTCMLYIFNETSNDPNLVWGPIDNKTVTALTAVGGIYYNFTGGDGDYVWNIWCNDTLGHSGFNATTQANQTITLDTKGPYTIMFNITNATSPAGTPFNGTDYGAIYKLTNIESNATEGVIQGATVTAWFNFSDTTTGVKTAFLQVLNGSTWMNITALSTNISNNVINKQNYTFATAVDSYQSGANVTMRVVVLDHVNNENFTRNLTVQVNDTVNPDVTTCTIDNVNSSPTSISNITGTTFALNWTITEKNNVSWLFYCIDGKSTTPGWYANYSSASYTQSNLDKLKTGAVLSDIFDSAVLPGGSTKLVNGSHGVEIILMDSWGNTQTAYCNFTVDTTVPHEITVDFNKTKTYTVSGGNGITPTNATSYVWVRINVSASKSGLASLEYNTSCNSTLANITNTTWFQPFNNSLCEGEAAGLKTLMIIATSGGGGINATTFSIGLDNTDPVLTLHSINDSVDLITTANIEAHEFNSEHIRVNFSTSEWTYLSSAGYYLDNDTYVEFGSSLSEIQSHNYSINVTEGGTHTLILQANDSVGNAANTTKYTFTVIGPVDMTSKWAGFNGSLTDKHMARVLIRNSTGGGGPILEHIRVNSSNPVNISIDIELNTSQKTALNITISNINTSAINWGYIGFSVVSDDGDAKTGINSNFSASLLRVVRFNSSIRTIDDFISDTNSYYGMVIVPYNLTVTNESKLVAMWFENESDYSSRYGNAPLGACTAGTSGTGGFTTPYTSKSTTPCYNITSNVSTTIFVPHFSMVAVVNDTNASVANVNVPIGDQVDSAFIVNVTVSQDASSCAFKINASGYYNGVAYTRNTWTTMSTPTLLEWSKYVCLSSLPIALANLSGGGVKYGATIGIYNLTINVTDAFGNQNITYYGFNVTDTNLPLLDNITNSSIGSSSATIGVESNEYINASVTYSGSSTASQSASTAFTTKTPTISLTGLSSSTFINYTVKVCDYAGNCNKSSEFNFTTAAAAAVAPPAAAVGGGGGGIGYQIAVSNVKARTSHMWSSISSGESVLMNVVNPNIGVTNVNINVKNTLANAKIEVASLKAKPDDVTAAAATVYQYLQITPTNLKDADITRATIKFRVLKSWLTDNGVSENDIVLFRYANNAWSTLATTKVDSDGTYVYYEATTTGFSYYAIGTGAVSGAFEIIDAIRAFYDGTSTLTAFDIIDMIRSFYGG